MKSVSSVALTSGLAGLLMFGAAEVGSAGPLPMVSTAPRTSGPGAGEMDTVPIFCAPDRCSRRPFWRYGPGTGFRPFQRFGFAPARPFGFRPFAFGRRPFGFERFGGRRW